MDKVLEFKIECLKITEKYRVKINRNYDETKSSCKNISDIFPDFLNEVNEIMELRKKFCFNDNEILCLDECDFRRGFRQGYFVAKSCPNVSDDDVVDWSINKLESYGPPGTIGYSPKVENSHEGVEEK